MKKMLQWTMSLLIITLVLPQLCDAQGVKRQSIGSYGTNAVNESPVIGQTIGQPFSTGIYSDNVVSLAPGFQQPLTYKRSKEEPLLLTGSLGAFPNPATSDFTIQSTESLEEVVLNISDINGRKMLETQLPELKTHTVDCSSWQAGVYFVTVTSQNFPNGFITKIVKTK